jgi:predicted dehydrogenase
MVRGCAGDRAMTDDARKSIEDSNQQTPRPDSPMSRRDFVWSTSKVGAIAAAAVGMAGAVQGVARAAKQPTTSGAPALAGAQKGAYRVGVIGCGGRGTGAAVDFLRAAPEAKIVSMGDVFPDRLAGSRGALKGEEASISSRVVAGDEACFTGFDAYKKVLAQDVDVVILATPPHFRPIHLAAAIEAGKHCFIEKPVAVDPTGVRIVMKASALAKEKNLGIVAGTQRRHQASYLAAIAKIKDGAIGRVVSAQCYWNQGGLWMNQRRPEWSDMEWQLRNWLYFAWLSGDHIVEQHVHNIDVMNWAIGSTPLKVRGMGGRQVRTSPEYGHIYDHFAIEYEYADGVVATSQCRQIEGCDSRVEEVIVGTKGRLFMSPGRARIEGETPWKFAGEDPNPYEQEHRDLVASIASGTPLNEGQRIAESTLTAVMGRMAAYTGKAVAWEKAMQSTLDLSPAKYEFGSLPVAEVAVPGKTPLV